MKKLDLSVFPKVDKSTWKELAKNQLKGADPNEELSWQPFSGFTLLPYYDSSDLEELDYLIKFFNHLPNHHWKLYEEVQVKNEKQANQKAISALMGGCDGILFILENDLIGNELLRDINSEICDLSFIGSSNNEVPKKWCNYISNENCFFESQIHQSPISQISEIISSPQKKHIYRSSFSDFFIEIACLRALRYLLNNKLNMPDTKIHTHIPAHTQNDQQWFFNTSAGIASILGGSHSISFSQNGGDNRISRNVGNLIREESGITVYSDQCGGSYYVETLTHKLTEEALKELNK